MATVGVVEWAVDGIPTEAKIVYELDGASAEVLNRGGEAPVDLTRENYRTLLLGLKQSSSYSFSIEATVDGEVCVSDTYSLPETGSLSGAPPFAVSVDAPEAREPGFIVTSSGYTEDPENDSTAFILDADGEVVWAAPAPPEASRAKLDYEGENMWMLGLNFGGGYGEMRYLSLDGQVGQKDIAGLEPAHHDFTVMPGGKVAALAWTELSIEGPESELLIRSPDGTIESAFLIGENLYLPTNDRFHCNAVHYVEEDDSFTISDRYASAVVKVSSDGEIQWQLGGSCAGAPAGPDKCSEQNWNANHGHQLLSDGSFLIFNNSPREGGENSNVLEFDLAETETSMTASLIRDYEGTSASGVLGDVQRLPGGNTLITYSQASQIVEVDADWQIVQTFSGDVGYAEWRPTLYGPPARL